MSGRRGLVSSAVLVLGALTSTAWAQPAPAEGGAPPPAPAAPPAAAAPGAPPAAAPAPTTSAAAPPGAPPPAYGYHPYAQPAYGAPGYAPQPAYVPQGYAQPAYAQPGYAQPGYPPPGYAPAAPATPAESPADRARAARQLDANADRVVVMPTAYTHPKGTFYASSYDIVLLQIGYAVSDTTQVSLTATPPLGPDHVFPADLSVKTRVVEEPGFRLALTGSATGISGLNEGPMFLGRAGVVAQFCFDDACRGSISAMSNLLLAGPAMFAANGAGVVVPATHWLSFLAEAETLLPLGREVGPYNGIAFGGGVRFPYRTWALDLTVVGAISGSDDTKGAAPLLVFTYRFLP